MEVMEQVYKGGTPSKISNHRADTNFSSHGSKWKGVESNLPTNPKKVRAGKRKKIMKTIQAIGRLLIKHACFISPDTPQSSIR